MFGGNFDLASEHTFGKCAAFFILQDLVDAPEFVHKTSDTGVRSANHRAACFHAAKNGVSQMLMRSGGMQKPSVVRYIDQQISAGIRVGRKHESSDQFANGV